MSVRAAMWAVLLMAIAGCARTGATSRDAAPRSTGGSTCGASTSRAVTRDAYPPTFAVFEAEEREAMAAGFRRDNPADWAVVDVDALGRVVHSYATREGSLLPPTERGSAAFAANFFRRNARYFGIAPEQDAIREGCAQVSGDAIFFWQFWGPYRVGQLKLGRRNASGTFWSSLAAPPAELADDVLVASLVGRRGTLTTVEVTRHRPCDPGPSRSCPEAERGEVSTREPTTLAREHLTIQRSVLSLASPRDPRLAELRIVAVINTTFPPPRSKGPGSPWTETTSRFAFDPNEPPPSLLLDAVTGESLADRRPVIRR